jgi:formylglycine-generating enzyme required for sulfatase activity
MKTRTVVLGMVLFLAGCISHPQPWVPKGDVADAGMDSRDRNADAKGDIAPSDFRTGDDAVDIPKVDIPADLVEVVDLVTPDVVDMVTPPDVADVATDIEPEDAVDLTEEDICQPDCEDNECGDDGCGGSCGECDDDSNPCTEEWCTEGSCISTDIQGCCQIDADCDDESDCTIDSCEVGKCVYEISSDLEQCATDEACDDCNPCTVDSCVGESCQHSPTAYPCCSTDSDCYDYCATTCAIVQCINYKCYAEPIPDCCSGPGEIDCYDNNECTYDMCVFGKCKHFGPPFSSVFPYIPDLPEYCCSTDDDCDDDNPCTKDHCPTYTYCDPPAYVCTHSKSTGGQCDDGNDATVSDTCVEGQCVGCLPNCEGKDCGDDGCGESCGACAPGYKCQGNSCMEMGEPTLGCEVVPSTPAIPGPYISFNTTLWDPQYEEGTVIKCYLNGVYHSETKDYEIDIPDFPTGMHSFCCQLHTYAGPITNCDATCCLNIKEHKSCELIADCNDNNPCSVDACTLGTDGWKCSYGPSGSLDCCVSDFDCDCSEGKWQICNPQTATCVDCLNDVDCDDGDNTTVDSCVNGSCVNCTPDCDGKECGDDGCGGSCGICGDTYACTVDTCGSGTCIYTLDNACVISEQCFDDGDKGTDFCLECKPVDSSSDWTKLDNGTTCGENAECQEGACNCIAEKCVEECCDVEAVCFDGGCCTPQCDGKECGDDGCGGSCGECTGPQEECVAGQCKCQPDCEDKACGNDGCVDSCGTCDDGNPCNGVETCDLGACVVGESVDCSDVPQCMQAQCNPLSGACDLATVGGGQCDDGDACTLDDVCAGGECESGKVLLCSDGNECTEDSCSSQTGCIYVPAEDGLGCADGDGECVTGMCEPSGPTCGDVLCPTMAGYSLVCNSKSHCEYSLTEKTEGWHQWDVWVYIPPGDFSMGSPGVEDGHVKDESDPSQPNKLHPVTFTEGYFISKHEITVEEYEACKSANPQVCSAIGALDFDAWDWGANSSGNDRSDHPQNGLTWQQANGFCGWVAPDGRLPSEAEWEFAAKGTSHRMYPWGHAPAPTCSNDTAVFNEDTGAAGCGCSTGGTWPVGSMSAGMARSGALDMAGNLWEWCLDDYHYSYEGAPTDGTAWIDGSSTKALRAGSFQSPAGGMRSAERTKASLDFRAATYGARCARPVACSPDCAGKQCGDDGCGGSCGACGEGLNCLAAKCTISEGLIGWWDFREGEGTTAHDLSGEGHHGEINSPEWVDGLDGNALSLDGANTFVDMGMGPDLHGKSAMTMAVRFKTSDNIAPDQEDYIVAKMNAGYGAGYWMNIDQATLRARIYTDATDETWTPCLPNTWYHAVVTYDGSKVRLYLSGSEVEQFDLTGPIDEIPSLPGKEPLFQLGCVETGANLHDRCFKGLIDDVRIYERALQPSEIQVLFNEAQ